MLNTLKNQSHYLGTRPASVYVKDILRFRYFLRHFLIKSPTNDPVSPGLSFNLIVSRAPDPDKTGPLGFRPELDLMFLMECYVEGVSLKIKSLISQLN